MFEGPDTNEGLPEDEAVTADVVDLAAAREAAEAEGDGVEDSDFEADQLEAAEQEAA